MKRLKQTKISNSYSEHKERWNSCTLCSLCNGRNNVVLARGTIPAPVLLCGEAPGESENVLGRPFTGPAGHLLDRMLEEAWQGKVKYALTNLVACIPRDEKRTKTEEPPKEAILACAPRLREFITLCKPRVIIAVGQLAAKWLPKLLNKDEKGVITEHDHVFVDILHPAAILRMESNQSLAIKRCIVTLTGVTKHLC